MGISSSGLISGINADQLVSGLINLERRPITLLQQRQQGYELKIASFLDLSTKLSSFKSALDALNSSSKFSTRTASVTKTSSGTELLTVSASSSATAGSYSVQVNQLAAANKKASQGWVDENTTAIASSGGTFKFKVGSGGAETSISVGTTTTLQGLRDAINSANAGVTASILNDGTGSNPYRLILQANTTGSSNTLYITSNPTNLDFSNKKVEAAYAYTTNSYAGTVASNDGNNYTGTTNKTFLLQIVTGGTPGSASAKYKYSIDGGINWLGSGGAAYTGSNGVTVAADGTLQNIDGLADGSTTTEGAKVKFTGGTLAVDDKFSIDVFNPEMQAAQDAVIKVDNTTITKSTNTITDAIQGVTMNLLKTDSTAVTLSVSSDTAGAKTAIKSFVDTYNTLFKAINDQLTYDSKLKKKNPLLGDPTLLEIRNKIGNVVSGRIPGLSSSSYQNLSQIGITSDKTTGKLTMDDSKVSAALSSNPDAVSKLFIGTASVTNTAISYVSKTSKTQAGTYSISVSTAPEQATLLGGQTIASGGITLSEQLTFMFSKDKTASTPTYTTFSVSFNASTTINTIVDNLNSAFATNKVGLSASNESGKIRIKSTDYGADIYFKVTSDRGNVAGQIGFNSDGSSYDAGVDIVGMINGHVATGKGNTLTGTDGFPEAGLKISTTSNQTGGFGSISVSSGVADRLSSSIGSYTNSSTGIIKSRTDSIQKTVDTIQAQMDRLEERLVTKEKRLRDQFVRLETLLSKLNAQSQYLTQQLSSIPKIGTK